MTILIILFASVLVARWFSRVVNSVGEIIESTLNNY